ncbi:ORF1254 [White spot syndrome virus]|uniref:ORF1254 n=1 Tax=White spot syndrome virus TaxID=342409 RepID=A0A2D3I738_9VIRU|nr:ORF1254 [White spot syndrome virus]
MSFRQIFHACHPRQYRMRVVECCPRSTFSLSSIFCSTDWCVGLIFRFGSSVFREYICSIFS